MMSIDSDLDLIVWASSLEAINLLAGFGWDFALTDPIFLCGIELDGANIRSTI